MHYLFFILFLLTPVVSFGQNQTEEIITKEKGVTVVNTTSIAQDIEGYAGPTPVKIYIRKNKVERVEALPNIETPRYFELVKQKIINKWDGQRVDSAETLPVDVVTGATYSSEAVIQNVRRGISYYKKTK